MLCGRLQEDWGEYNVYKSREIAEKVLLEQQQMQKFPVKGAAFVPNEAHWFHRVPLKQKYNPKNHLPSQTVSAARRGHKEANVLLFTMGCDTKGSSDPKVRFAEIQNKLRIHGHKIPEAQIFDCVSLGGKIDRWNYATDCDWKLFTAVWKHPKAVVIFNEFYSQYRRFNQTCAAGDDFVVVFYCKSGAHQSVATAKGLQTWLMHHHDNISVKLFHNNEGQHMEQCSCCNRAHPDECERCQKNTDRKNEELSLLTNVLTGKLNMHS